MRKHNVVIFYKDFDHPDNLAMTAVTMEHSAKAIGKFYKALLKEDYIGYLKIPNRQMKKINKAFLGLD